MHAFIPTREGVLVKEEVGFAVGFFVGGACMKYKH
jgi:hypothetical protein